MIARVLFIVYSLSILLLLSACGEKPIYEDDIELSAYWTYRDTVSFNLPADDTLQVHDLLLEIEHQKSYPFQNLYINITTEFPSGRIERNKLNIDLSDKAGQWYGDCSRNSCDLEVLMLRQFRFSETGIYRLILEQYTRRDSLEDIDELSILLY